jgi:Protein of unknown function (DUF2798)
MEAKPGSMLAMLVSGAMELMATFLVTVLELGWRAGPPGKWINAYVYARPMAVIINSFIMPPTRRLTERYVTLIDGRR